MASIAYDKLKEFVFDVSKDLTEAGVLKVALVQEKGTTITDTSAADVSSAMSIEYSGTDSELTQTSGDGYSSGGLALENVTISAGSGISTLDADDLTWSTSTITAGGALLFYSSAATVELGEAIPLAYLDFSVNRSSTSGDFTLQWLTTGIITVE